MLYRVRQFVKGLFACTSKEDNKIVEKHLNRKEKELFDTLPAHEKRHAIDTASAISCDGSDEILIKAGLLHDIGKTTGNIGIVKKSVLVLMDKFFPVLSKKLSGRLSMFNIYYNHPEIGADLLENTGTEPEVIMLVKYHHSKCNLNIEGLEQLKKADSSS